jgi:hypothetical protein
VVALANQKLLGLDPVSHETSTVVDVADLNFQSLIMYVYINRNGSMRMEGLFHWDIHWAVAVLVSWSHYWG